MARSLSWIDEAELAAQLARAGVAAGLPDVSGAPAETPTQPPLSGAPGPPPPRAEPEALRIPGRAVGRVDASSPENVAQRPGAERPFDDGTGTEPRWPVRTPTAPGPVPAPADEDEAAMPGPDDDTPTPPSFRPPTPQPETEPEPEPASEAASRLEDDDEDDVTGPGPDDPTPPPLGGRPTGLATPGFDDRTPVPYAVRAAMDALAQARRAASGPGVPSPASPASPGPLGADPMSHAGAVDDIPTVSPFGRASSAARTSPFLDRPPTGTALARIQLQARARVVPSEEDAAAEGADFARKSTAVRPPSPPGLRPNSPTEELMAVGGALSDRLDALVRLLVEKTGSRGAYVADDDGRPLAAAQCSVPEVALSSALREALRPVRVLLEDETDRSVTLELRGPEYLHIVWVDSSLGRFAVGLYTPRVLGGDLAPAVRRMLERLVSERPDTGDERRPEAVSGAPDEGGLAGGPEAVVDPGQLDRLSEGDGPAGDAGEADSERAEADHPSTGSERAAPPLDLPELPAPPTHEGAEDAASTGGDAPEERDEDAELDAVLAEDIAPPATSWAGQLVRRLHLESDDPERALRRVALRTGLELGQLRDPSRVPESAREALEQAVRVVLGEGG